MIRALTEESVVVVSGPFISKFTCRPVRTYVCFSRSIRARRHVALNVGIRHGRGLSLASGSGLHVAIIELGGVVWNCRSFGLGFGAAHEAIIERRLRVLLLVRACRSYLAVLLVDPPSRGLAGALLAWHTCHLTNLTTYCDWACSAGRPRGGVDHEPTIQCTRTWASLAC